MDNKIYVPLILIFVCLFCGCNNNRQQQAEIEDINLLLDKLISRQYTWLKNLDTNYKTRYEWPDSIYQHGNYLIDHINLQSPSFLYSYNKFNKEFGGSQFDIKNSFSEEYAKTKIKLLQYYAISEERRIFYECHDQVDRMGFTILNDTIKKGKTTRLCLMPTYEYGYREKAPIFFIGSDTLRSDDFYKNRYYFDFCSNEEDTWVPIKAIVRVWHWDEYRTFDLGASVYVKK